MYRQIGWALLVGGVVFFGGLISSEKIKAQQPQYTPVDQLDNQSDQKDSKSEDAKDKADAGEMETLVQLKEINVQLKEIKALLRSGDVRVTVVMNPKEE
jgi:hypothetical protein